MNKFVWAFLGFLWGGLSLSAADRVAQHAGPIPFPVPVWLHEAIAPGGSLNDLELDSDDQPHVIFVDESNNRLRYAQRQDGSWRVVDLAPFDTGAPPADLAFDLAINPVNDLPAVAYVDPLTNEMRFGRPIGTTWQWELVGAGGRLLSLRIDSGGGIHLVAVTGQVVTYISRAGDGWHHEPIGAPDAYVWNLFLDLDEAGQPQVAGTGANGSFHARYSTTEEWVVDYLSLANIEGFVIGPDGEPRFLITEAEELWGRPPFSRITLSLAERTAEDWAAVPLWQADDWMVDCDLAVGGAGTVYVTFSDKADRPQVVTVDSQSILTREFPALISSGHIGLALDSMGNPQIAHHDGIGLWVSWREVVWHDQAIYLPIGLK